MARAKRTDRADARRRNRATQPDVPEADGADADDGPGATSSAARGAGSRANAGQRPGPDRSGLQPGQRPSFTGAFRAAARPFDVRSDIAYIPTLVLRTRAVWVPGVAAVGSGVLFLTSQPLGSNGVANLAFQLFVLPPTIAGSFLAGILAPRATYVAGGIAALIGALMFSIAVLVTPVNLSAATITPTPAPGATAGASDSGASPAPSVTPAPSPTAAPVTGAETETDADKVSAIVQAIALSVPFGIAIGAFGGYYKRFLYLSNPGRQRRAAEQQRQKTQRNQPGKRRY